MNTTDLKMHEVIGLLVFICMTVIGLKFLAAKSLDFKSFSGLILLSLIAGLAIARYDSIKWLGLTKDTGVELYQKQVDSITDEALSKIGSDVEFQKQSLKMVITDANTTREKLEEQKKSLEALYEKTKAMETRLDTQHKEIEATIAKSGQIEASLVSAQNIITKLNEETKVADGKLKLLDEKTAGILRLPDGRLKMGGFIAGEATLLGEQGNKIQKAYSEKDWVTCYEQSKIAIHMVDESVKAAEGVGISTATLNPEYLADIYQVASDSARITNHAQEAVEWAKIAVQKKDTGSNRAALVLSLRASNDAAEAQKVIAETLAKDAKIVDEFRATMTRVGSPL